MRGCLFLGAGRRVGLRTDGNGFREGRLPWLSNSWLCEEFKPSTNTNRPQPPLKHPLPPSINLNRPFPKTNRPRDAITYSAVISALSKGRQWALAIDVFNFMSAVGARWFDRRMTGV